MSVRSHTEGECDRKRVYKIKRTLVEWCFHEAPDAPSRLCRWFGHPWSEATRSRLGKVTWIYKACNRCGESESWYELGSDQADRALASASAPAVQEQGGNT